MFSACHEFVYRLLGVEASASAAEVKAAFRKLALKLHPDVSDAPDAEHHFKEVAQAYGNHVYEIVSVRSYL